MHPHGHRPERETSEERARKRELMGQAAEERARQVPPSP